MVKEATGLVRLAPGHPGPSGRSGVFLAGRFASFASSRSGALLVGLPPSAAEVALIFA